MFCNHIKNKKIFKALDDIGRGCPIDFGAYFLKKYVMEKRKAIIENEFVKIPWGTTGYFMIDSEDYDKVKDYDWYFHLGKFRSKSYKRGVSWYLHHLLFGYILDGRRLQYRDGNVFNYRKENLYFIGGKVEKLNC